VIGHMNHQKFFVTAHVLAIYFDAEEGAAAAIFFQRLEEFTPQPEKGTPASETDAEDMFFFVGDLVDAKLAAERRDVGGRELLPGFFHSNRHWFCHLLLAFENRRPALDEGGNALPRVGTVSRGAHKPVYILVRYAVAESHGAHQHRLHGP